jgi:hypothetical protein
VHHAETLSESSDFRPASVELHETIESFKALQRERSGWDEGRSDVEQLLWQRLMDARTHLRARRERAEERAAHAKRDLCARAEGLARSSDFSRLGAEAAQLRDEWRLVGHAGRAEPQLWERFNCALTDAFEARAAAYHPKTVRSWIALAQLEAFVHEFQATAREEELQQARAEAQHLRQRLEARRRLRR